MFLKRKNDQNLPQKLGNYRKFSWSISTSTVTQSITFCAETR